MQKKITSKNIYNGTVIQLTQDVVEIENGLHVSRDIIHHPGGVGILVLKDHKILFVRQFRYPVQQSLLEIPAGKLEPGEDPMSCGIRELEEETGYRCSALIPFASFYTTPGFCDEKLYLYEAKDPVSVANPKAMDEDECITTLWLSVEDACRKIQNGEIQDAKTMIAVHYAKTKETV